MRLRLLNLDTASTHGTVFHQEKGGGGVSKQRLKALGTGHHGGAGEGHCGGRRHRAWIPAFHASSSVLKVTFRLWPINDSFSSPVLSTFKS